MSKIGMGVIYTHTHNGEMLRREINQEERENLLNEWYRPNHQILSYAVEK